jgi:uncharacterized protein YkwD
MLALTATMLLPSSAHAIYTDTFEREQLRLINDYRADRGLARLRFDVKLTRAADWMGRDMGAKGYFSHTDSRGRDPFQRMASFKYPGDTWRGENLAAGNSEAQSTFNQWLNSEAHRLNMVKPEYRAIGISRVADADSQYGYYWVTKFGSKVSMSMPSQAVQNRLKSYSSARRRAIKIRARACSRLRRNGFTYRRLRCGWNLRTARNLRTLGF